MSYQSEVLADAPLGYWRLDLQDGNTSPYRPATLADSSGNGRPLTTNNNIWVGAAPAAQIGGQSGDCGSGVGYASLPAPAWLASLTTYTVECWIKTTAQVAQPLLSMENTNVAPGNSVRKFNLYLQGNGHATFMAFTTSGGAPYAESPAAINDGFWHHLVGTNDGTTIRLYVDGALVGSTAFGGTSMVGTSDLRLGAEMGTGRVNGFLDEAAVYAGALSAARVKTHYDTANGITSTGVSGTLAAPAPAAVVALTGVTPEGPASGALAAVAAPATVALTGTIPTAAVRLEPWAKDESRKTRAVAVTSGVLDFTPPLELPPGGVVERPLMRESVIVPALKDIAGVIVDPVTGQPRVPDDVFAALPRVAEEVGVPHVLFSDLSTANDRTYWRGGQIRVLRDRCEEPFGDVSLTLELPQVTSMDADADSAGNDSPLNWSRNRSNVEIVMRKSDGTTRRGVWTGHVVTHDGGNDERSSVKTLTCHGSLWQAASTLHRAPNLLDPTDVGALVPKALNDVVSRRYPKVPTVTTGIMSRQRGTWSDSQMAFAQELLSTAQTSGGRQWTIAKVEGSRRTYEMRLKKDTPSWTVTNGAPGVAVSLSKDATVIRNVVYGHGVGPDGYAWWNYHYPNLRQDDAPAYPYSSAGTVMSVGSTDAGTSSGEGVSVWQRRARDLGYNVAVDATFNDADAKAARAIQRRYGLQVDSVVGPQTWAATFDVGGNGGDLSGAIRLPLAADPRTQRYIYNADGSVAGDNPAYDVNVIAYEADIDFGPGVTREQGIEAAQQIVDRESEPALVGQITLKTDPREGSRFFIPTGDKISLLGYEGHDPVLHITARERDWQNLTVTLEVDERARDAMTVQEIRDRNKAARKDPARRPGNVERRSRLVVDQVVPFDGESGAGWIPRLALYGGLWTVIRVPVSELGRVARIDCTTSGPASKFTVALFGSPIQPAHLDANVGNPLASDDPFGPKARLLEDRFGFIEAWGQKGQACGYGYGSEQDNSPLTGEFHDTGGFEYASQRPPWIWVAFYSASSTFVRGRILPAPIQ